MNKNEEADNEPVVDLEGLNENTGARGRKIASGKPKKKSSLHPEGDLENLGFEDPVID
ncbi:hypothetical protein KW787_00845 [Candidatus Pacearchaeota archaeon]|nr:hypothetical protein [Candidatus Pacearchaeota archaeon]